MKIDDSLSFLEKLQTDAQKFIKGEKQTRSVKKTRADIALGLDKFRRNLGNPLARANMASLGYRFMLLSKLGFNFSHFLVNLTQTAVNTWPLLNTRAVTTGIGGLMQRNQAFTGGRTADQIMKDSGLLLDPVEFVEFSNQSGIARKLEEVALFGTRKSEEWNRGIALLGGYHDFLAKKGIKGNQRVSDELHQQALASGQKVVEQTQFPFNRVGTPRLFRSPGAKLFFQFMTYPLHQMNFSMELVRDAVKQGNWSPLLKQSMAYMTLFGIGAGTHTQIWDRTRPPAVDFAAKISDDTFGASDLLEVFSGPAGTAMTQALKGNFEQAGNTALAGPTMTRVKQLAGAENFDGSEFLFGSLFKEKPKKRTPLR
jgi:hypothetical protein